MHAACGMRILNETEAQCITLPSFKNCLRVFCFWKNLHGPVTFLLMAYGFRRMNRLCGFISHSLGKITNCLLVCVCVCTVLSAYPNGWWVLRRTNWLKIHITATAIWLGCCFCSNEMEHSLLLRCIPGNLNFSEIQSRIQGKTTTSNLRGGVWEALVYYIKTATANIPATAEARFSSNTRMKPEHS